MQVSRSRRRTARFTVALTLALSLSGMLVYTTFSAASPERFPGQIASYAKTGQTYRVGGQVLPDSSSRKGGVLRFSMGHPGTGEGKPITVEYRGTVPDTFREGRDIIIDVQSGTGAAATFVGQGNTLVTKCPSKFNGEPLNAPDAMPAKPASSAT